MAMNRGVISDRNGQISGQIESREISVKHELIHCHLSAPMARGNALVKGGNGRRSPVNLSLPAGMIPAGIIPHE